MPAGSSSPRDILEKAGARDHPVHMTEVNYAEPAETTASVGDGTWGKSQRSFRFNVAHEIAHAAFIRAATQHDEDGLLEQHRPESILRASEASQLGLEVGWGTGEVIPCNVTFRRIQQKPLGFLLAVQIVGPVQKPGQETLFD